MFKKIEEDFLKSMKETLNEFKDLKDVIDLIEQARPMIIYFEATNAKAIKLKYTWLNEADKILAKFKAGESNV